MGVKRKLGNTQTEHILPVKIGEDQVKLGVEELAMQTVIITNGAKLSRIYSEWTSMCQAKSSTSHKKINERGQFEIIQICSSSRCKIEISTFSIF